MFKNFTTRQTKDLNIIKFTQAKRGGLVTMYETPALVTNEFHADATAIRQMLSADFRDELRAVLAILEGRVENPFYETNELAQL
jgi:hypothetical protein